MMMMMMMRMRMMMFIDVFLSLLDTAGLSARTSGSCCTRCGGRGGPQNPWSDLCQSFLFASMVYLLFKYSSRFVYLLFFVLFDYFSPCTYVDWISMVTSCIRSTTTVPHDGIPDVAKHENSLRHLTMISFNWLDTHTHNSSFVDVS